MKTIQVNRVVSFSKGRTRAQVIVLVGEGRNQRSVTRHIMKQGYHWVGLNTDERAPELNSRCESELATAESNLRAADASLGVLLKERKNVFVVEATEEKAIISEEEKADLEAAIEAAQDAIYGAEVTLTDAKDALAHVQRECPRQVEFTGVF